jgi:2-polyprenyl-6-methoxyphenol hydroxylase-like FAD-dependent oxidoreductase
MSTPVVRKRGHAIIAGASFGGLVAARAVSESFARVTIIDRDDLSPAPAPRPGVPQGRMTHGLTARGTMALEQLLPGLLGELAATGARIGDAQSDVHWYVDGRLVKPVPSELTAVCASRPLLELALRSRVAARPGVRFISRHDVIGLDMTPDSSSVTGIRLRSRDAARTLSTMPADLVVDATGRGTSSASWLDELGYRPPAVETVPAGIGYACRVYRHEPRHLGGRMGIVVGAHPGHPEGGVALAQEGGRLILSIFCRQNALPPTDPEGMASQADALPTPEFARIIRTATPLSETATMRFPASARRRYEELADIPAGFLAVGDALCAFNPVYGQGMSVAAAQAQALLSLLREGQDSIAARFFRAAAEVVDGPWSMVLGNDLRFPDAGGVRTPEADQAIAYMNALKAGAAEDAVLAAALLRVMNGVDAPSRLRDPALRERVSAGLRK